MGDETLTCTHRDWPDFDGITQLMLSRTQIESYQLNGFLVLEKFADDSACDRLMERASALVAEFEPGQLLSIFSSTNQRRTTDDYFLSSGDKIRFFFEEEAFDDLGHLKQSKERSINKIGHALHDLDPEFDTFSRNPSLNEICVDLGITQPLLMQSMYIFKQPHIGGEVTCHQDATYLFTNPMSVTGFWFALEDAKIENACLWAIPGGHRTPVKSRFVRTDDGNVKTIVHDPTPWPPIEAGGPYIPLEVPKGTLVVLHGSLPHLSGPNRSPKSRHAYTVHVVDGACDYPKDNWLQRPESFPARGF